MCYRIVFNYEKMISSAKSMDAFNSINLNLIVNDSIIPLNSDNLEVILELDESLHSISICSETKISFLYFYINTEYKVSIKGDSIFEISTTNEGKKTKFVLENISGEADIECVSIENKTSTKPQLNTKCTTNEVYKEILNQALNDTDTIFYKHLGVHICLLLFTFGIYQLIWVYKSTQYTNKVRNEDERTPILNLLLYLFIPFYSIYWTYKTAQRVDTIARDKGINSDLGTICLILALFVGFIPPIILQDKINEIILKAPTANVQENPHTNLEQTSGRLTDELITLKRLLDQGIITQEEFDAKKKQLLGL